MIKCIIYDLCDTIVKTAGISGLDRLNSNPINNLTMNNWFNSDPLFKAYERGQISVSSFANIFRKEFNIEDDEKTFCENYESLVIHEIDGAGSMIKHWSEKFPLYALSNNNPLLWNGIQKCCTVLDCFSKVFLSHETGLLKPEAQAFESVLNTIDCRPEQAIFVDDNPKCITAARQLGMWCVQFDDAETTNQEIHLILKKQLAQNTTYIVS